MRGKDLLDKMELCDGKYIAESAEYKKKEKMPSGLTRIAAVVLLIAAIIPAVMLIVRNGSGGAEYTLPLFKDPVYTAAQIGAIFDDQKNDARLTNAYTRIFVPSENELKYVSGPVPDGEYVGVYELKDPKIKESEASAKAFGEKYLETVCKSLGIKTPSYKMEKNEYPWEDLVEYSAFISEGKYFIGFAESGYLDSFYVSNASDLDGGKTVFDGIAVTVDQTQNDEEMTESLQPLRKKLCEIFDADLPDIQIVRTYDASSEYGCTWLTVCFFNAEKNGVDFNICKCSDYIRIYFDNTENYRGDIVSKTVLTKAQVSYVHCRCKPEKVCKLKGIATLITLKEAEALLYNGYVFGGHVCPLCMAEQEKIAFDNYDKVGLVYYNGVPFYAFFKKTDLKTKNGNITYARTLVPAVAVSGYEEYFESQKAYHS